MKKFLALAILPAALFTGVVLAQQGTPDSVRARLQAAGYSEIRDIEFDDGLWEAEVRRADGRWDDIAFDPASNEVFDARNGRAVLDARGITDALQAAGYTDISDLDRDGALWDVEALDATGQRVELRVSGYDGRVITSEVDHD